MIILWLWSSGCGRENNIYVSLQSLSRKNLKKFKKKYFFFILSGFGRENNIYVSRQSLSRSTMVTAPSGNASSGDQP